MTKAAKADTDGEGRCRGEGKGTVSLSLSGSGPRARSSSEPGGRLVFSADRRSLLSIPESRDQPSIVWGLATAKLIREFENEFTAEMFFPDARRVVGMTGSEITVRDVTTGGTTKR